MIQSLEIAPIAQRQGLKVVNLMAALRLWPSAIATFIAISHQCKLALMLPVGASITRTSRFEPPCRKSLVGVRFKVPDLSLAKSDSLAFHGAIPRSGEPCVADWKHCPASGAWLLRLGAFVLGWGTGPFPIDGTPLRKAGPRTELLASHLRGIQAYFNSAGETTNSGHAFRIAQSAVPGKAGV